MVSVGQLRRGTTPMLLISILRRWLFKKGKCALQGKAGNAEEFFLPSWIYFYIAEKEDAGSRYDR